MNKDTKKYLERKVMKAPDRIFLHGYDFNDEPCKNWDKEPKAGLRGHKIAHVEYIRKDLSDKTIELAEDHAYFAGQENFRNKVLEWAKENLPRYPYRLLEQKFKEL